LAILSSSILSRWPNLCLLNTTYKFQNKEPVETLILVLNLYRRAEIKLVETQMFTN